MTQDDLKEKAVAFLDRFCAMNCWPPGWKSEAEGLRVRMRGAEVSEGSRLDRVRAALPEGFEASHNPEGKWIFICDREGFVLMYYRDDSPASPEEAAQMAARLAGVEEQG